MLKTFTVNEVSDTLHRFLKVTDTLSNDMLLISGWKGRDEGMEEHLVTQLPKERLTHQVFELNDKRIQRY